MRQFTNCKLMALGMVAIVASPLPVEAHCVPAPSGLVGWWAGEGNAKDTLGKHDAEAHGQIVYSDGEVGEAFNCDGYSGYFKVPASPALDVGSGKGFTVEMWVEPAEVDVPHVLAEWNDGKHFTVHFNMYRERAIVCQYRRRAWKQSPVL